MQIIHKKSIYQLAFMPRFFPVNCYLVEEEDSLTLIDAAMPFSLKGILQAAIKMEKPITKIVLTHAHMDHIGALDALKQALPDVPVYISERDSRIMAGDLTLDADEPHTPIRGGVPKNLKTRADVLLHDGDQIGSLMAISTPGHTPGSMSFIDTRTQALIAGDAFQTRAGIAVSGQLKLGFPFPAMATWNKQIALNSAQKLIKQKPSLLAVGHGQMIEQPVAAINRAIMQAEKKLPSISS